MPDPISIITLIVVGLLAGHELIKLVIKISKLTLRSNCCNNIDMHQSNHNVPE